MISHTTLSLESVEVGRFESYLRHSNYTICNTIVLHIIYWIMDVILFFQSCLHVCAIFPWVIDQCLQNSYLSSATFFSHWIHVGFKILCFIKFNMVSNQVFRPASNLRKFHWCTRSNWDPHKSRYSFLDPSIFCPGKSIQVWCTQRKCTCRSGECLNWFDSN